MADSTTFILILIIFSLMASIAAGGFFYVTDNKTIVSPTINIESASIETEDEGSSIVENYNYGNLSKDVNINIKWSNGSDFGDVTNMYFIRKKNGTQKEKKEVTASQRASNAKNNTIKFTQGTNEDMRGTHNFVVTFKLRGSNTEHEMGKFDVTIKDEDITLGADTIEPVDVVFEPVAVTFSGNVLSKKTKVKFTPTLKDFEEVYLIPVGDKNKIIIQRVSDNKYLKWGGLGNIFLHSTDNKSEALNLYILTAPDGKYRISTASDDSGKLIYMQTNNVPIFKSPKPKGFSKPDPNRFLYTLTFT